MKCRSGFSLVELMIVMVLLVIVTGAVAVVYIYGGQQIISTERGFFFRSYTRDAMTKIFFELFASSESSEDSTYDIIITGGSRISYYKRSIDESSNPEWVGPFVINQVGEDVLLYKPDGSQIIIGRHIKQLIFTRNSDTITIELKAENDESIKNQVEVRKVS